MLEVLERKLSELNGPIVAANVGPPDADKVIGGKRVCKLVVVTTEEMAGSYFPLGFEMVATDLAVAYMTFNEEEAAAIDRLRQLGDVLIVSKAKRDGKYYVFDGVMMAYEVATVGNLSWHVLKGIYPPLMEGKEYLYKAPIALSLIESVASGGGLSVPAKELYPIEVTKGLTTNVKVDPKAGKKEERFEVPGILLLPALVAKWRAHRVSSKKASPEG
ncbi:hypothetical protein EYM_01540 [Ignicoccus islandicus DSM 13165]|uniref:Uncharacterized protein n=1 Tax=Ignicoccus islandicus DSM 13165 TaxID=940295 RepID=A0A0U3E2S7_9CREN|nr:hypothetical protein [Ignicoccus islandicus]ALU12219.1 hypothetical protein EYM_01540 [Ignicoccus islandicus DSM 13165]